MAVGRIVLILSFANVAESRMVQFVPPSVVLRTPAGGGPSNPLLNVPVPAKIVFPVVSSGSNPTDPIASEGMLSVSGVHVIEPGLAGFAFVVFQTPPLTVPMTISDELSGSTAMLSTAPLAALLGAALSCALLTGAGPSEIQFGTPESKHRSSRHSTQNVCLRRPLRCDASLSRAGGVAVRLLMRRCEARCDMTLGS